MAATRSAADFVLSASDDGTTTFSGAGLAESAVMPGVFDLAETGVAGYTASAWNCIEAEFEGSTVSVGPGADVECTITNDDQAVDLELVKSDGGAVLTPGGAPITYTISVSNLGGRSIDGDEPVTVTDVLPSASMSWVEGSGRRLLLSGRLRADDGLFDPCVRRWTQVTLRW